MKKIIDGKLYDTETATRVGSFDSGGSCRDFSHFEESLYKTPGGAYFVAGSGGPMTGYARSDGQNSWTGSEDIRALTREEAFEWAQSHLDADETQAEFGDLIVPA